MNWHAISGVILGVLAVSGQAKEPFSLGSKRIDEVRTTAYTHTEADHIEYGRKTAAGTTLRYGKGYSSAAADWSKYPLGTKFKIEGMDTTFVVDDYGRALVGTETIDIYKPSRSAMNNWGVRHVDIQVLEMGDFEKSREILAGRTKYAHVRQMLAAIDNQQKDGERGWSLFKRAQEKAKAPDPAPAKAPALPSAPESPKSAPSMALAAADAPKRAPQPKPAPQSKPAPTPATVPAPVTEVVTGPVVAATAPAQAPTKPPVSAPAPTSPPMPATTEPAIRPAQAPAVAAAAVSSPAPAASQPTVVRKVRPLTMELAAAQISPAGHQETAPAPVAPGPVEPKKRAFRPL
ncbi:MAG: hypothetical protein JNK37_01480 [Verrucomicrobiales bacterium]|nr:hypothetical protein [Verrucomicrobiales bacterium]